MKYHEFVKDFCGGRLELPLVAACYLTGVNANSIKNSRADSSRGEPALRCVARGRRLFVSAAEIFSYLKKDRAFAALCDASSPTEEDSSPSARRGAPPLEERQRAAARGLTVSELRRQEKHDRSREVKP